jgi:phospholipase C
VVSPYSKGGHVAHSYADHVSILKFIERNWRLEPLSTRSRDNLPNPIADEDHPYAPVNGRAISDLFVMFEFEHDHDHRNHE